MLNSLICRTAALFFAVCSSCNAAYSQTKLSFTNSGKSVPYVSILDSSLRFYRSADSNGYIHLPAGSYDLIINHVSFETKALKLIVPETDTQIIIALDPRNVALDEVRIRSGKPFPRKNIRNFGNAFRRSRGYFKIPMDVRTGMVFKPEVSGARHYLNSVTFRLKDIGDLKQAHDNLEIRVYKMNGNTIAGEPANLNPIYLKLDKIRIFNTVRIDELIEIPADGVFISFELPAVSDEGQPLSISFVTTLHHDDCNAYSGKVSKTIWNSETFPTFKTCYPLPMGLKNSQMSIGITYFQ